MKRAIYAGSFDPITKGHLDIIQRAAKLFDEVLIAVATNTSKNSMLESDEKLDLITQTLEVAELSNVKAVKFESGLIVDFAVDNEASVLVRGLRTVKDFEYESAIDANNKVQNPDIETVYLVSSPEHRSVSSTIVREIIHFNGNINTLVPKPVEDYFKNKAKVK